MQKLIVFIISISLLSSLSACEKNNSAKVSSSHSEAHTSKASNKKINSSKSTKTSSSKRITTANSKNVHHTAAKKATATSASETKSSSSASSNNTGLNQTRAAITAEEKSNDNKPLNWEPIKNAQQAEARVTKLYGNKGWITMHGTVGISSQIYFSETSNATNTTYVIYATGKVTAMH